jgi:hypothetical protein
MPSLRLVVVAAVAAVMLRPAGPPPLAPSSVDDPPGAGHARRTPPPPTERPGAWAVTRAWTAERERDYARFVEQLGRAVAQGRCSRFEDCLRDPSANRLHDPVLDEGLDVQSDCADLPYLLRAYFAWHRGLAFGFVARVEGDGEDRRFLDGAHPTRWLDWRDFPSAHALLRALGGEVHSGMLRGAPDVEDTDFYPVEVGRREITPGAVYYDPYGHVLVVAEVRDDGEVHFIDGHPDGSLTWTRLDGTFHPGPVEHGGGFKRFRPLARRGPDEPLARTPNARLADLDGRAQWDAASWQVDGAPASYARWVRARLALEGTATDPVGELGEELRALCRAVGDRVTAVGLAGEHGLPAAAHPAALPDNIYGTYGDWETYATPGKDAHLRALAVELRATVAAAPRSLRRPLGDAWREEASTPGCRFAYRGSAGAEVALSLDDVLDRLAALSFDPYHCSERRWGAPAGSAELRACREAPGNATWYRAERRLRNRTERTSGPTALDDGPAAPPAWDARPLLGIRRGSRLAARRTTLGRLAESGTR